MRSNGMTLVVFLCLLTWTGCSSELLDHDRTFVEPGVESDLGSAFGSTGSADMASSARLVEGLSPDTVIEDTLSPRFRAYGFVFQAGSGAVVSISLEAYAGDDAVGLERGGILDTFMALYGRYQDRQNPGELLARTDDGETVAAPPIEFAVEESGQYLIAFSSWQDTGTGNFRLTLSCRGTDQQCLRETGEPPMSGFPDSGYFVETTVQLDSHGYPHISYGNRDSGGLRYTQWNGHEWHTEIVVSDIQARAIWFILDANDEPHISLSDDTGDRILYVHRTDGEWNTQLVDSVELGWTSLALDSAGNPHIAYTDGLSETLKYAQMIDGAWAFQTIDSQGTINNSVSLMLDQNDHAHISYWDLDQGPVKYAHWTGSEWEIEVVDNSVWHGEDTALTLDQDDTVHIAYSGPEGRELRYAVQNESGWDIRVVDQEGTPGYFPTILINQQGQPQISYVDWHLRQVRLARWTDDGWMTRAVAGGDLDDIVTGSSFAIDSENTAHVTYCDVGNELLGYVRIEQ